MVQILIPIIVDIGNLDEGDWTAARSPHVRVVVSDKQKSDRGSLIDVPAGGSFDDMVALKGDKEIGDKINKIIGTLAEANDLKGVIDEADFNDEDKLGREQAAKVKVDCSRTASDLLLMAMEICGGVSSFDEFGLIRHHNDLFVTRVGEGSNFVLKDLIVRPLRAGK